MHGRASTERSNLVNLPFLLVDFHTNRAKNAFAENKHWCRGILQFCVCVPSENPKRMAKADICFGRFCDGSRIGSFFFSSLIPITSGQERIPENTRNFSQKCLKIAKTTSISLLPLQLQIHRSLQKPNGHKNHFASKDPQLLHTSSCVK